MKKPILRLFILVGVISILLTSTTSTVALGAKTQAGKITLETDAIVVEIRGGTNQASFYFWEAGNTTETEVYKLMMDQIFEAYDNNTNGAFDLLNDTKVPNTNIALSSREWNFSEFDVESTETNETLAIHFNMTSSEPVMIEGNGTTPVGDEELMIQFRIHMDTSNTTSLKFDIVIDGYQFASDNSMLVLGFKLMTTQEYAMNQVQNIVRFGEAYFQSNSSANDTMGGMEVGLSYGLEDGSKKIYVAYEHFEGLMVHDPTIGLSADVDDDTTSDPTDDTTDDPTDDPTDEPEDSEEVPGFTLLAGIGLAIPVIIRKRK